MPLPHQPERMPWQLLIFPSLSPSTAVQYVLLSLSKFSAKKKFISICEKINIGANKSQT